MNKISICTVCMNRLLHLRETLPANIRENIQYPHIEFVALNYNSRDGMDNWMRENMMDYINQGILKYYKTNEPVYFNLSHSKNMAMRLATGDIICMVDADNFAGPDYAAWINSVYSAFGKSAIVTTLRKTHIPFRDQGGKLGFSKEMLYTVRGFDEALNGYGVDDVDLVNRLEKAGAKRVFIENHKHLKYIGHSEIERFRNYHLVNNLEQLYICTSYATPYLYSVLYVLKDNVFFYIDFEFDEKLKNDMVLSFSGWKIKKNGNKKGTWARNGKELQLYFSDEQNTSYNIEENGDLSNPAMETTSTWKKINPTDEMYYTLLKGFGECRNRLKMMENDESSSTVNPAGWGKGIVYMNFQEQPIHLS